MADLLKYVAGATVVAGTLAVRRMRGITIWSRINTKLFGTGHKLAIVTGASCGIGKATAAELARYGARVIMIGTDHESVEEAAAEVREVTTMNDIVGMKCDLASFKSIHKFVDYMNKHEGNVDILINNAAVFQCPHMKTEDGLEMQMGVNYFGHFLLTNLLIPKMHMSTLDRRPRIVNVTSSFSKFGNVEFDNLNSEKGYDKRQAFYNSKLAMNLFSIELAKRCQVKDINVYCAEPLFAKTYLDRYVKLPFWETVAKFVLAKPPRDACQTIAHCALSEELEQETGRFYYNTVQRPFSERTIKFMPDSAKLWEYSKKVTHLDSTIGDNY